MESPLTARDRDHLVCTKIVNNLTLDNPTDITYTYYMKKTIEEVSEAMGVSMKPTLYLSDKDIDMKDCKVGDEIELKGKIVSMTKSNHKGKISRNMTVEIEQEDDSEDSVEE